MTTLKAPIKNGPDPLVMAKLHAILEAIADRIEMHKNTGDQRNNWNTLLLISINSLTLAAAMMAGIAAVGGGAPAVALKVSATVMYVAAAVMLSIMNKIQPSQLTEEQRNASRLFKNLQNHIGTVISIGNPGGDEVKEIMEKVLALDKAYPLPLLGGAMLEKFPAKVEPAVWWPELRRKKSKGKIKGYNGCSGKLEEEMKKIVDIIRNKDKEDYLRLGRKALNVNRFLAVSGPVLTGLAAVGSGFMGSSCGGEWAVMVGVVGGALASVVNMAQHGGQVGMVFEIYRGNGGFFKLMEESIEWNLREEELERRENGEVFELKVGLQLGRSLSELRNLAAGAGAGAGAGAAEAVDREDMDAVASKLF